MTRKNNFLEEDKKEKITLETLKEAWLLFKRFNRFILKYWKIELGLLIMGNFGIILSLVMPYIGKNILDKGILAKNMHFFIKMTILSGSLFLFNLVMGTIRGYYSAYVSRKVSIDLTKTVLKKIRKLSLSFFQNRSTGEVIYRINRDVSSSASIIIKTLPNMILTVIKFVFITVVICHINWKILILVVIYQVFNIFKLRFFAERIQRLKKEGIKRSQHIAKILHELFSHIYFIKSTGTMSLMVRRHFHNLSENIRLEIKNYRLGIIAGFMTSIPNKLFYGTIGFVGTIMVIKGSLTLGSLGAIIAYLKQGISAYSGFLGLGNSLIMNKISLERLTELLDAEVEVKEKPDARFIDLKEPSIEFKDVSFGYKGKNLVLDKIDLTIPSRTKIALVGHSGRGKTTILNLILRLYDVKEGCVRLGGHDIRGLRFKSIYDQVSIALQTHFLWNSTIKDNINYLNPKMGDGEIKNILKTVEMHDFVEGLEEGWDSILGERACRVSQGQRQRLAIARSLAKHPKILMLDEALSSVDSETENKIINNIKSLLPDTTLIIVSHRLSAVKNMDIVYFLENAQKIDYGAHKELLRNNYKYRELFSTQIENEELVTL